jgi:four helix bundle protein
MMGRFDFEKLTVYQRIREINARIIPLTFQVTESDKSLKDQLRRATLSVALNLAEGTGRISQADKGRFYVIARSSTYECVAILQALVDLGKISPQEYETYYHLYTEVSKMLFALHQRLKTSPTPN